MFEKSVGGPHVPFVSATQACVARLGLSEFVAQVTPNGGAVLCVDSTDGTHVAIGSKLTL